MKIPKISGYTVAKVVGLAVYAVGASVYGVLNYMEGQEAEWDYLTDNADTAENGARGYTDKYGNNYIVVGNRLTKQIMDMPTKNDEEDNS